MKIGDETRVMLEIIGTGAAFLAFITPGSLLALWVQSWSSPVGAMAVIVVWVCLGGLGMALYMDNKGGG